MQSGEDRLIARYFKPIATAAGALSLNDDAAFFEPAAGFEIVLKTDAVVAGIHFLPDDPPDSVARKALRVNLSDLAAKGATPAGCLMTLALPDTISAAWLEAFSAGLKSDCEHFGCPLYGGDTVRTTGPISVSIFAFGTLPRGTMVRRAGAKPGDRVFLTGTVGDASLGLRLLREPSRKSQWLLDDDQAAFLVERYRVPRPKVTLSEAVRTFASASMDVSDGLVGDLAKLCEASNVSAHIQASALPLSDGARRALHCEPTLLEPIATGGDDYEILCTLAPEHVTRFRAAADKAGVAATEIGEVVQGSEPPLWLASDGSALHFVRSSFSHF